MSQFQTTHYAHGLREPPPSNVMPMQYTGKAPSTLHFFDEQYSRDAALWEPEIRAASNSNQEMARYLRHEFAGPRRRTVRPTSGGSVGLAAQFSVVEEWGFPRTQTINNTIPTDDAPWEPWRRPLVEGAVRMNERPRELIMETGWS